MKNCIVVIRNKKLNFSGEEIEKYSQRLSREGYFFDGVFGVGFDSNDDITRALKNAKNHYDNAIIFCPAVMKTTVEAFVEKLYGAKFDNFGVLNAEKGITFLCSGENCALLTADKVAEIMIKRYGSLMQTLYIKTVGAPSGVLNRALNNAATQSEGIEYKVYGSYGELTIEIMYAASTPKTAVDAALRVLATDLDGYIYALEDITLAERLYQLLKLRRMKISVAESFTGGGIAKRLVEVSGISEVYEEGLNTYSNEAKAYRLGVDATTLNLYGAVSEQTACQMAQGLIDRGNCDVSIATTGIAGPKSDNTSKPVGLCYIAIGLKDKISVYRYQLAGDRKNITETAINHALFLAYKLLK